MKRKVLSLIVTLAVMSMLYVGSTHAAVPAPPANQDLGIWDGIFNEMDEDDCRACHDDPNFICSTSNVDRHHLYYGEPIQSGECSVNSNACLSDADCLAGICEINGTPCTVNADCPDAGLGETCGEVCRGETAAPILDGNSDGSNDTNYGCLNCHPQTEVGGAITFIVVRDCLECHIQVAGEGSVHHLTDVAQGRDSPLGDDDVGDCTPCHGTLVDDIGDGHMIPVYDPSLVTPTASNDPFEGGTPLNSNDVGSGACNYCHDAGVEDLELVFPNDETHHNTGVFLSETGAIDQATCNWCHNVLLPADRQIRVCEGCHGYESLHNIAADTDSAPICFWDPANPTVCEVVVGGEEPGYSHVGNDSDCWGCHGFEQAGALGSGPITPFLSDADGEVMTAGVDTSFTLTGVALTNLVGTYRWVSEARLTAVDGSTVTLSPDSIAKDSMTVTIPGTTGAGTYKLQAVKGNKAASNPVVINIKPEVRIDRVTNNSETYTITGTGFGDAPPAGAEEYLNVQINGGAADVISWNDTEIVASVSGYGAAGEGDTITVNALFCDSSFQGSEPECIPDCTGNFDSDEDVDGTDAAAFMEDFGRNLWNNPCESGNPCNGDLDCDGDVDGTDAAIFKGDFGRNSLNNPCQPCTEQCSY